MEYVEIEMDQCATTDPFQNTPLADSIIHRESAEEPNILAVQLPKVRAGAKTYFGKVCAKHPEHKGFRQANTSKQCVACEQERVHANNQKLVPHPNGSGEMVTQGYANNVKLVPHPNGSGEMVTCSYARSVRLVPHPDGSGKLVKRGYAESVKLVPHPDGSGKMVTRGHAESVKLVQDPWNPDGPLITYGLARHRKMGQTPEGRALRLDYVHTYKAKKRGNTPELDAEDQALTLQTIKEIQAAGYTVDHMQAVNDGGPHAWWNLNALTKSTNSSKRDRSIEADCWLDMQAQGLPADTYEKLVQQELNIQGEQE
jgi:hypothetical protein